MNNVHVEFHKQPYQLGKKSREAGRPIYEDRDYIRIMIPGQPKQVVDRQVQEKDKIEYAQTWGAYIAGEEAHIIGTPVDHIPGISVSVVKALQHLNIVSVEQMAEANEIALQKVGHGARDLQSRAKAYLGQNDELDTVKKELADLKKLIEANAPKPKRTRRTKAQIEAAKKE